jgi:hypothetical protein
MGQRRVGLPVVSPGSVSVSNTSFDHLRHRGRLPLKLRAVPGLIPQMAGMIDVLGVRQEIGGRRSRRSLGTCLRQHPSSA